MIRLLQISNYFYPHIGGIEQVARDIAGSLSGKVEQKIICFDDIPSAYPEQNNNYYETIVDGVSVVRCKSIAKLFSQSISLSIGKVLKNTIKSFKPNVIIFHYPNPLVETFLKKYLNDEIKLIVYWHSDIVNNKIFRNFFNSQTRNILGRANTIVATSPNYIEHSKFLNEFRDKVVVIPNAISTNRLAVTDDIKDKANIIRNKYKDKIICFAIGRHVAYKGYSSLIKASRFVNNNIQIIIGGSGPLTNSLKHEAKDTKIDFIGKLSDFDLIAYYTACDIVLFPSITKNEAFGISLAEGMYFAKPAITYYIQGSGVNYVNLKNVTGLECPCGDYKAYANAINTLSNDSTLRNKYSIEAKHRVEKLFLNDSFSEKIEKIVLDKRIDI